MAWRIFHLAKLGRETPDVSCTVFFEEAEWKALTAYITQNPTPPDENPRLRDAMQMVPVSVAFWAAKVTVNPVPKLSCWACNESTISQPRGNR